VTAADDETLTCGWPQGPHSDVVISMDGRRTAWCLDHGDDMLPVVMPGLLGGCVLCGLACTTWTHNEVCLHEDCRRERALRQIPRHLAGAYARRRTEQP